MMSLWFIHAASCIKIQFLFGAESYSKASAAHTHFRCSPIRANSGCFHISAVVNNAALNMGEQIPTQVSVFSSFG